MNPRLDSLDVARGCAALSVVFSHWVFYALPIVRTDGPPGSSLLAAGTAFVDAVGPKGWPHPGVVLFIVLSGFCIHLPHANGTRSLHLASFFTRRLVRIYPVFFVAVLVGWLVHAFSVSGDNPWAQPTHWTVLGQLAAVAILPAFFPAHAPLGNEILSTVISEVGLYLLYPVGLKVVERVGWTKLLGFLFVLAVAMTAAASYGPWGLWPRISTWGFLFFWWLGAAAAEVRGRTWRLNRWARAAGLAVIAYMFLNNGVRFRGLPILTGPLFAGIFALVLVHIDSVESRLRGWGVMTALGQRSYSLYAFHWPAFAASLVLLNAAGIQNSAIRLLFPVVTVGVTMGLLFWALERPCMDAAKAWSRRFHVKHPEPAMKPPLGSTR